MCGCSRTWEIDQNDPSGLSLKGHFVGVDFPGKGRVDIKNKNTFVVLVREVQQMRGESTMALFRLAPGESQTVSVFHVYYISMEDGRPLAFLRPEVVEK